MVGRRSILEGDTLHHMIIETIKDMLKKIFLIGIAALFLATGTAHACHDYFRCGKFFVDRNHAHATVDGERQFWPEWTIFPNPRPSAKSLEFKSLEFKCKVGGGKDFKDKCWLNGNFCRLMSDEEWHKEFPDAD